MRVPTNQLEALACVARMGSFRAAASYLGLTQPSISMRIRELERLLDVILFDRSSHRALLTEKGRELAGYAERILALADEMRLRAAGRPTIEGLVRIGAADTFALTCLPALLTRLQQLFPGLRVDLQIDYSVNLHHSLQRGQLDVAFLTGPVDASAIGMIPLVALPLAWVTSPHLSIGNRRLQPDDLRVWPILSNPRPSHLYRTVREWFGQSDRPRERQPKRLMTCNSLTIMTRLAAQGFGLALLPIGILRTELEFGSLRRLRTHPAIRPHELLTAYRNEAPRELIAMLGKTAAEIVAQSDLVRFA